MIAGRNCAAIAARAEELIMVGDSYDKDVAAARLAGWQGIWLHRDGTGSGPYEISDLRGLAAVVADLTGDPGRA